MADGFMDSVLEGDEFITSPMGYFLSVHGILPNQLNNLIRKYDYLYEVMWDAKTIAVRRLSGYIKKPPKPKKYKNKGGGTTTTRINTRLLKMTLESGALWRGLDAMDRSKLENRINVHYWDPYDYNNH
jgi:hypothetical protein